MAAGQPGLAPKQVQTRFHIMPRAGLESDKLGFWKLISTYLS